MHTEVGNRPELIKYPLGRPSAFLTAFRFSIDNVPVIRNTSASSRVISLPWTLNGTPRSASCQPWITTSLGQSVLAEVTSAGIDC